MTARLSSLLLLSFQIMPWRQVDGAWGQKPCENASLTNESRRF